MNTGTEGTEYVIEPIEDPVPKEVESPEEIPSEVQIPEPEKVPA